LLAKNTSVNPPGKLERRVSERKEVQRHGKKSVCGTSTVFHLVILWEKGRDQNYLGLTAEPRARSHLFKTKNVV